MPCRRSSARAALLLQQESLCHSITVLHLAMLQAFLDVLSPAHQLVKVQPKQASPSTYGLLDRQCMSTCSVADVGAMLV